VLLVAVAIIYSLYSNRVNKYRSYLSYSTNEKQELFNVSINAFLDSVTEEDGIKCFNLLTIDEQFKDFQICENSDVFNWENPYEDYSKLIPVNLSISFSKKIPTIYLVEDIDVRLLEDEEYIFFLDLTPAQNPRIHIRIKSSEDVQRQGYHFSVYSDAEDGKFITILRNQIDKIELEDDKIVIYFTSIIEGQDIKLKTITEEFYFYQWEKDRVDINKNNVELLSLEEQYYFVFYFSPTLNEEGFMRNLINSSKDTEYLLIDLDLYEIFEQEKF
jgi:hypothetical protein